MASHMFDRGIHVKKKFLEFFSFGLSMKIPSGITPLTSQRPTAIMTGSTTTVIHIFEGGGEGKHSHKDF
jgi:hypothetical protein